VCEYPGNLRIYKFKGYAISKGNLALTSRNSASVAITAMKFDR